MDFNFNIPLRKAINKDDYLIGIASTLAVDRDSEKMSEKALRDMQEEIITNGVNLFGNHEHNWENTLGLVKDAKIEQNQLKIGVQLDNPETNDKVMKLVSKLKRGIRLGLSVGGVVTSEKMEYNKELNRKVKVIDGVKLLEISVVGIPSNTDSFISLPAAIAKCMKQYCPVCHSKICNKKCNLCLWSE